ncbi:hypothetical protein F53441_5683 [Fusarium austroafricanum]|uniref:Uncharacterized protein n=1 Tax=Fusarium austroafricanum TaxID=2364996 RepID=A0A8H4P7X1_9HYPO|nr:hypothetical protein F53441_5683 [Fusarium austroafricanum]
MSSKKAISSDIGSTTATLGSSELPSSRVKDVSAPSKPAGSVSQGDKKRKQDDELVALGSQFNNDQPLERSLL